MAAQCFIRDQNLNVHSSGASSGLTYPTLEGLFVDEFIPAKSESSSLGGGKTNVSNKGAGRREALGDPVRPPPVIQEAPDTKLRWGNFDEPCLFGSQDFYQHNHGACHINAWELARAANYRSFLKEFGLGDSMDSSTPPPSPPEMKPESPFNFEERMMESDKICEMLFEQQECELFDDELWALSPPRTTLALDTFMIFDILPSS